MFTVYSAERRMHISRGSSKRKKGSRSHDFEVAANASTCKENDHKDCNEVLELPTNPEAERTSREDQHQKNVEFLKNLILVLPLPQPDKTSGCTS